jgi:hypothetical protein
MVDETSTLLEFDGSLANDAHRAPLQGAGHWRYKCQARRERAAYFIVLFDKIHIILSNSSSR